MPKVYASVVISIVLGAFVALYHPTSAAISSCEVSVSPSSVTVSSASGISFSISNTSSETIQWIQITRSNDTFEILGTSSSGWNASNTGSTATFSGGGSIAAGSSGSVGIVAQADSAGSGSFTVQVSDSTSGASPTTCSGSTSVSAEESAGGSNDSDAPTIGSISVTSISASSAVVNWTTNESTSGNVEYGTSESYGNSAESSSGTSHAVTLSGLSAQTRYHYKIEVYDESGNSTSSGDNVFETQPSGSTTTSSTTGSTSTSTSTTGTSSSGSVKTGGSDSTRPVVTLTTDFTKPFDAAPSIEGKAIDTNGIGTVEYSTDNGVNWLPVDRVTYTSDESAVFSFRPSVFEDNNYAIRARASDSAGNVGLSREYTLILDALPPSSAGYIVILGSQLLSPQGGRYRLPALAQGNIVLSARGGPTTVNIVFDGEKDYQFEASKNEVSGFWESGIVIPAPGEYRVTITSTDGAQNETNELLGTFFVVAPAQVAADGPLDEVRVTAYKYNDILKRFLVWDADPYDQLNPVSTTEDGVFSMILPEGEYYLEFSKGGYRTLRTSIISAKEPTIISQTFTLTPGRSGLLGLYRVDSVDLLIDSVPDVAAPTIPESITFSNASRTYTFTDIIGKPTLLAILPSWMPQFAQTISMLTEASSVVSVMYVSPSDTIAQLAAIQIQGQYSIPFAADITGSLKDLNITLYPTFILINAQGKAIRMSTGNMSIDDVRSFIE